MKLALIAALSALSMAPAANAQDGFYFGAGVAAVRTSSDPGVEWSGFNVSGRDAGLALTAGYNFASVGNLTYGIEGNLDFMSGKRMDDSCVAIGPVWCEIDSTLRLRGTATFALGTGGHLTTSLGAVMAKGTVEDAPGLLVNSTGTGVSVGLAWQAASGTPLRYDLNFDRIRKDDAPNFDRSLDMISLRVSYMF